MVCAKPVLYSLSQNFREFPHLCRLEFRDCMRSLVIGNTALLAEQVELSNQGGIGAYRELERVDHSIVMIGALGSIPGGRQRGGGQLKRAVIRDIELPVGAQGRRLAVLQISIGDGEEIGHLQPAGLMVLEPSELSPIPQAHSRRRSQRFSGRTRRAQGSAGLVKVYDRIPRPDRP